MEKVIGFIQDFAGALAILFIGFGFGCFCLMLSMSNDIIWDILSLAFLAMGIAVSGISLAECFDDRKYA